MPAPKDSPKVMVMMGFLRTGTDILTKDSQQTHWYPLDHTKH